MNSLTLPLIQTCPFTVTPVLVLARFVCVCVWHCMVVREMEEGRGIEGGEGVGGGGGGV